MTTHEGPHGSIRDVLPGDPLRADGARLVRVADLGERGVVEVRTDDHGTLAVGMADGVAFATSNVCRHQAAKLGRGAVRDGCLQCPWHRARFDVRTGDMVRGPQGKVFGFGPYSKGIQLWANGIARLKVHDVDVVDGWIVLRG